MLIEVEITNPADSSFVLTIPISYPTPGSKYLIRGIDGLGPVKASVNLTNYSEVDGALFNSSNVGTRNIVMLVEYMPDWSSGETVADLRRRLQAMTLPKAPVRLKFISDDQTPRYISGRVEANEPVIFSKDAVVQISIICEDPSFRGDEVTFNGMTWVDVENPTLADYDLIEYPGDVPTGMIVEFEAPANLALAALNRQRYFNQDIDPGDLDLNDPEDFALYLELLAQAFDGARRVYINTFSYAEYFIPSGRVVRWDTNPGINKFSGLKGGPGIVPDPPAVKMLSNTYLFVGWPTLVYGDNYISVEGRNKTGGATMTSVPYVMKYTPRYGGL